MFSEATVLGYLTRDLDLRYTQDGAAIAETSIASTHKWKTPAGEDKEQTMFIDITFFGSSAETATQHLKKGARVFIKGRLAYNTWTTPKGIKKSKHSIIVDVLRMLGDNN